MTRAATITAPERATPGFQHEKIDWGRPLRYLRRHPLVRSAYVRMFRVMQSFGISVTPVHFYFPVPDVNRLRENYWPGGAGEAAVNFDLPGQLSRLQDWNRYSDEWTFDGAKQNEYEFKLNNGFFETVDAEIAYSIVRQAQPKKVIEVGGGNSTRLLATALRKNAEEGHPAELISIEPYPDPLLQQGFPGMSRLIRKPVQEVEPAFFDQLEAGDVLFLDSSHVVSIGSDVVYEMLEILPRLKAGVIVHFHDIFIPAEYPRKFVLNNLCFWGEQYMLQAFLCGNRDYRVLWSSSMMQLSYPSILRGVFKRWEGSYEKMPDDAKLFAPSFDGRNVWPCSFWIEKVA